MDGASHSAANSGLKEAFSDENGSSSCLESVLKSDASAVDDSHFAATQGSKLDSFVEDGDLTVFELPSQVVPERDESLVHTDDNTVEGNALLSQDGNSASKKKPSTSVHPSDLPTEIKLKRDGTPVDPNRKYISQMSFSEKVVMQKLMYDKMHEYYTIGKEFCQEKNIPLPNRKNFQRIIYELIMMDTLDVDNLKLKLVEQVDRNNRSQINEDEKTAVEEKKVGLPNVSKFRDYIHFGRTYCRENDLPIPSRHVFSSTFRLLKRRGRLNANNVMKAMRKIAESELNGKMGPSIYKPAADMTDNERAQYFKELNRWKDAMMKVAVRHCHAIKAPFPKNSFYQLCKDLFDVGQLSEEAIISAVDRNFEKECNQDIELTLEQLKLIAEHYCKGKGVDMAGKSKEEILREIPSDLLNHKHCWALMYDEKKTNLFTDISLVQLDNSGNSSAEVKEYNKKRSLRRRKRGKNCESAEGFLGVSARRKPRLQAQSLLNGDLREILPNQHYRNPTGIRREFDDMPIQDMFAQIASKTILLGNLTSQNTGSGYGCGGNPALTTGFPSVSGNSGLLFDSGRRQESYEINRSVADQNPESSRRDLKASEVPFLEPGEICKVAIVDENYPERHITEQEASLIRNALLERMRHDKVGPRFSNSYEELGAVIFECEDQLSITWIWSNASKIHPWLNAKLKPLNWGKSPIEIALDVPKDLVNHSWEGICENLEKQNPGLSTKLWNLISNDSTPRSCTLVFSIDGESFEFLKSVDLRPYLGFSKASVRIKFN